MKSLGSLIPSDGLIAPRWSLFITLFVLDSLARTTLVTIVPLQAYAVLGDAHRVSILYFFASGSGLAGSMLVPWLVTRIGQRRTFFLGSSCMAVSALLLAWHALPLLAVGLALQMFGAATNVICLNIYILVNVPRHSFTRFEPIRIVASGAAWVIGPAMGVYLENHLAVWLPYTAAAVFSLTQLLLFRSMKLAEQRADTGSSPRPPNPVRFVRRFFRQPRLILAWLLSVVRAGWWGTFHVFGPIYIVSSGLSEETSGLVSSIGSAGMLTVLFWGWVGRNIGIRNLYMASFALAGILTMLVASTSGMPWIGAGLLIAGAMATSVIDSGGNVPFFRAVRPRERSEMTAVYATYRDVSRLSFPAFYSMLLIVFPLPVIFLAGGGAMLVIARCSSKLPRRLGREWKDRPAPNSAAFVQ